jgi:radical SAM superfamily enzyme
MKCPKCKASLVDGACLFCKTGIPDTTTFENLSVRFHKNNEWAKQQSDIGEDVFKEFCECVSDPLQTEQIRLIKLGMPPDELVKIFEGARV